MKIDKPRVALFGIVGVIVLLGIVYVWENANAPITCEEFQDNLIWSSGMSNAQDSISYYTWKAGNGCLGSHCFVQRIRVYVRERYYGDEELGRSYVQISNAEEANCNDPSKAVYSRYASYKEAGYEENLPDRWEWDCGEGQEKNLCSLDRSEGYYDTDCFSVKVGADKSALIDVTKIDYTWCWAENKGYGKGESVGNTDAASSWSYAVLLFLFAILIFTYARWKHES